MLAAAPATGNARPAKPFAHTAERAIGGPRHERTKFVEMAGFKDPGFEERRAAAQRARDGALEKLRAKPPADEAALAERAAKRAAKEAAEAEKRRLAREAREEERAAKRRAAEEAAAAAEAAEIARKTPAKHQMSETEKKALRDARYAARKNRKGK